MLNNIKMKKTILLLLLVSLSIFGSGQNNGKKMQLRLQVIETLPDPVIWKTNSGAENITGGFEGGSSVKVIINGKPEYHFFAHSYPKLDWSESQLDHWVSKDGKEFQHKGVLLKNYRDSQTGLKHIFCAPIPFYVKKDKRWYLCYGEFISDASWTPDGATMWYTTSKIKGAKGINGPFDFERSTKFVQTVSLPKPYNITTSVTANSAPFQIKDGRWAMFFCPNVKDPTSWPVGLAFGKSPLGPYNTSEILIAPMIEPTAFTENPMPIKVRGPKSGKDYWVAVFDFLAPEVTDYNPKNVFGFCWSEDGINWPKEHGQAVNVDDGLAPGEKGWWRGAWAIRTPHKMIDEGNNTYTIFFTGGSNENHFADFRAVGRVKVKLIEEEVNNFK